MTREQQITQASQGRFPEWGDQAHALELAFQAGAYWADNSLLEKIRQVDLSTTGRLHNIWHGMKQRCTNPKASGYEYYGAKGISVCDEWQTFVGFAVWALINGYSNELSIDRINTKGNYNPSNCRWADAETQERRRRMIHNYDTTSEELKSCPFCGGTPVWHIRGAVSEGKRTLIVKCQKCGTEQRTGAIRLSTEWLIQTATDKWNSRTKKGGEQ